MQKLFEHKDMISQYGKTTIVKPLREKNDFGKLQKDFASSVYPFKKSRDSIGIYGKQTEAIKNVHSQLRAELEEIQKWKTLIEMESRDKNKKIEELTQSTEEQRKASIKYQLEKENVNLQLMEEIQQRSFVSEKLHATKEMYSALKKHFNTLQGHFDYRNRIEDMIKAADNKRFADIENLKDMFNKMQLEQSDKIEYLNCTLEAENNKMLDMKERFELQLSELESEREALCAMVRNYENQIGNFGELLDAEKNKVQLLEKEKEKLKSDLIEMDKSNKYCDNLLREKEEALKNIQNSKEEIEKQLSFQSSLINDLEAKCRQLNETNEALDKELTIIPNLKQAIEQLKNEIVLLEKRLKEEENKNYELLSSLQSVKNENSHLEQKINEEIRKSEDYKDLQEKYKELLEYKEALLREKEEIEKNLKDLNSKLFEIETEKEKLTILCEEKSIMIDTLKNDYDKKLACEASKLLSIESDYQQLLIKLETTEGYLSENSKTFSEMEEKICNVESLKKALTKAEDEMKLQKQNLVEVLRLLQDTEAKYNKDRIAKETKILSYERQIEKLDFETKMLGVEVENFEKLKQENIELKKNVEKLNLEISDHHHKEEDLKREIKVYKEKIAEIEHAKLLEEEKKTTVSSSKDDCQKESENGKKNYVSSKMHHENDKESNVSTNTTSLKQPVIEKRVSSKDWELESSGSEYMELVFDEKAKTCEQKITNSKPKAKDIDSSGSECLELVYDEKSREAIGLCPVSGLGKNKIPATPNDEPKLLPFKTKRKRDGQNMTQEDRISNSAWRSPSVIRGSAPSTPLMRKFFTKRVEERDTPKSSEVRKPWF